MSKRFMTAFVPEKLFLGVANTTLLETLYKETVD